MKSSPKYDELDRLAVHAQSMEPAPLPELTARRMVRVALAEAAARPERRPWRAHWFWVAAALLVCGFILARGAWPSGTVLSVDPDGQALRIALLPGDAITIAPGAELELLSQTAQHRRIHLMRGAALFDVVKLRAGEDFEVVTDHARVRVLGTVFSVEISKGHTVVRTYEGRVHVAHGVLTPGSVWSSQAELVVNSDPLAIQAVAAVHARELRQAEGATVHALLPSPTLQAGPSPANELPAHSPRAISPAQELEAADASVRVPPVPANVSAGRLLLEQGEVQEALAMARAALAAQQEKELSWLRLEAQALRALGRFHEAGASYEQAAGLAAADERSQLAFDAAALGLEGLHNPARALVLIDRWALDAYESPLRERAGRLRVHALLALRRTADARAAARRYLALEPETAVSDEMRKLLGW